MCPYRLSLPPLTLHLPKELRELEKIVKDLQNLKDNVDELRKMCADCTVSQTERECGSRRESEQEKLNEGINRHIDEKNRLNEKNRETQKECGTDRVKVEKTMEGELGYGDTDFDKITSLEEKRRNKWEAERESNKRFLKENKKEEPLKEEAESNGKTKKEGAKEKEKMDQTKLTTAAGEERIVDTVKKKMVAKNNRETDRDINKDGAKGNSKRNREDMLENGKERKVTSDIRNIEKAEESDHHEWGNEMKEAEKKSQTEVDRGNDGIKMSEDHAGHTNREREQHREERKKDMEKGTKVERNNEKPKQSASIGHAEQEKTIKEGEDGERGTEIKTEGEITVQSVQRDSDGELAFSKETERADFVSISPTPLSIISFTPRHDYSHLITDLNQGITIVAVRRPTQNPGIVASGITENSPDVEDGFRTTTRPTTVATINSLGGPGQQIASETLMFTSATSARPRAGFKGPGSSTTTTLPTTTQNVYTTTFTRVADHSRWKAKKNISSNTKTGVKPLPGRGPKPGEKRKPAVRSEGEKKLKIPTNGRKQDRAPLPDKKTNNGQKQKPFYQKPITDQRLKPGKDPKQVQIPKPKKKPPPDLLPIDQNQKNNKIPKYNQEHTTDQTKFIIQKPKSTQKLPVQRPTTNHTPQTVNATGSDKDTQTDQQPESVEIPVITQNVKPEKKMVHPLKIEKPDQIQKPHAKPKSEEEKSKPDLSSTTNKYISPVHDTGGSETTRITTRPIQKPIAVLTENSDENPLTQPLSEKDSTPGQKLTPDRALIKPPDQEKKSSEKIPKINQNPKPNEKHTDLVTGQKTKQKGKPKPEQRPQTNQGLRTLRPDKMPELNPKSLPKAESNKTSKLRPTPKGRQPIRPTIRPGATHVKRTEPAVPQKPSLNIKTDLDPLQISETSLGNIKNSETDMSPSPAPVTQTSEASHSQRGTDFSPSTTKTMTLGPKTSNSLETGPIPRRDTLSEGFIMSPNSRITSDPTPLTASRPPLIPTTTRANKISRRILPSVIPSTIPGSTNPNQASNTDLQAEIIPNMEEKAAKQTPVPDTIMIPVPSPSTQTTSTINPNLRSTTSSPKPLAAESSTPSARELRVKIKQVAAFFNNSLSPNGRPLDSHPKDHAEDNQGGSRPDSKLPSKGKKYYVLSIS